MGRGEFTAEGENVRYGLYAIKALGRPVIDKIIEERELGVMADGAYQHVALDVRDIEEMYKKICENGYEVITDGIEQLPFWDNGVKFFMIKGPNEERIEFCQKL